MTMNINGHLPKWIDPRLTIGSMIIALTVIFGMGGFYYTVQGQLTQNAAFINRSSDRDEMFRSELRRVEIEDRSEREKVRVELSRRSDEAMNIQFSVLPRLSVIETEIKFVKTEIERLSRLIEGRR